MLKRTDESRASGPGAEEARSRSGSRGAAPAFPIEDFEIKLPASLGSATRARVVGNDGLPLVVVLGGISANRFVCGYENGTTGWWGGLVGEGALIDPARYRVLGIDFAADETGRTCPTTQDQAQVICAALDHLQVSTAQALIGASYGAMVGLSLAQYYPDRLQRLVVISAGAEPHPASTAWRELQRRVVALGIESGTKSEALAIARGMGMLSYRTPAEFEQRFEGGLESDDPVGTTEPGEYLRARGVAFQRVMTPERFLSLSGSIDRHRSEPEKIHTPCLLIGADSDQLVLPSQMESLAARLAGHAELHILPSIFGHDMFLKEAERIGQIIKPFLEKSLS